MSKQGGLGHNAYVSGNDLSGDITALGNIGGGPAALPVTGINKYGFERIGGTRDGRMEFTSWWNPDAGGEHVVLSALPRTDVILSYVCGSALGVPAACINAKQGDYAGTRGDDGSFTFAVQALANGFGLEWGRLATPGIRTDTTGTNGAAIDDGAATTFGLQAYLHVFGVTGTSVTVKLQDSPDGTTWTDVVGGAFTAATTAGTAQRIATDGAQTVAQYLRAVSSGTFTSAAFAVVVCRNPVAVTF